MSLLLISLISLHQPQTAEALPLTTATELLNDHVQSNQTIDHWIHEPEVRGTWGILSSCLFTLTLCVYTAIHLNVPRSEESFGARVLRKSKWVLVAIFAPEVVLYSAYVQWNAARVLVKDLNAIAKRAGHVRGGGKSKENISEPMEKPSWTPRRQYDMSYAFYVVMGGITIDVSELHDDHSYLTVTPEGVIYLAKNGIFLETSHATIEDKSKADVFAKVLVCLQVCWVIVLMSARLVKSLPLSLLEGHTLVHVLTALGMYSLWFKKPLDISEPTVIDAEVMRGEVALMLMRNERFGRKAVDMKAPGRPWVSIGTNWNETAESAYVKNYRSPNREVRVRYEHRMKEEKESFRENHGDDLASRYPSYWTDLYGSEPVPTGTSFFSSFSDNPLDIFQYYDTTAHEPAYEVPCNSKQLECSIMSGQAFVGGIGPLETINQVPKRSDQNVKLSRKDESALLAPKDPVKMGPHQWNTIRVNLSKKDLQRWEAAGAELQKKQEPLGLPKPVCYFVPGQVSNLPVPGQKGMASGHTGWIALIFIILCTAYGGVHLVAWHYTFATKLEQMFWRASCIDLVVAGLGYALLYIFYMGMDEFDKGERAQYLQVSTLVDWIIAVIAGSHFVIYTAARAFIVVESFLSLRFLPAGVYQTVSWVAVIPHF